MSSANTLANPLTIMTILASHHPPPSCDIMAVLPYPDPADGVQVHHPTHIILVGNNEEEEKHKIRP